jgi:hypothetical protein
MKGPLLDALDPALQDRRDQAAPAERKARAVAVAVLGSKRT